MKTFSKQPSNEEKLTIVPCSLCGSHQYRHRWWINGARFVTCTECHLVFQNPRPDYNDLAARYDDAYFQYEIDNEESFFQLMLMGLKDAGFFKSILPSLPSVRRFLDIGCATGRLLSHMKSLGWETAGVELCAESADYGNKTHAVNIHSCDLFQANFPSEHFSTVHASHLIEHVDNPKKFVDEVARILLPGGVFVCVTPTIDGFQSRLHGKQWRSAIPDHVTLFSKKTLRDMCTQAGLKVEVKKTWGGLAAGTAPIWLKKIADRWVKVLGCGDVLLYVARKQAPE